MTTISKETNLENQAESSPTFNNGWFNPRTAVYKGYPVSWKKVISFKLNVLYIIYACTLYVSYSKCQQRKNE